MKHLAPYRHAIAALLFAVVAIAALRFVPESRLDKLATFFGRLVEDPAFAGSVFSFVTAAVVAIRGAWVRRPPDDPSAGGGSSGGTGTAVRAPDRIERSVAPVPHGFPLVGLDVDPYASPALFALVGPACELRSRWRAAFWQGFRPAFVGTSLAGFAVLVAIALTGCGASALRTHSTIATVARVSVVTAGEAIARTCEAALIRCTDAACVDRVGADCRVAATAADAAIDGVRAYVDVIEVAARADEGQVSAALDLAVQTMARLYEALREALASLPSLGVTLPPLPPIAVALLRALAEAVTS